MSEPIDWQLRLREACREAATKGLKLERIGGGGWYVWLPVSEEVPFFQRPKKRITSATTLISFIGAYEPVESSSGLDVGSTK